MVRIAPKNLAESRSRKVIDILFPEYRHFIQAAVIKRQEPVQPPHIVFYLVPWGAFGLLKKGPKIVFVCIHGGSNILIIRRDV